MMRAPGTSEVRRVGVAGCKHTTRDLVAGLARHGLYVDHVVTISPEKGKSQEVAGYFDLRPFLEERSIPYTLAEKYSLNSAHDRETLVDLKLDLLLVMGWQRLIPDWWLEQLPLGALGMHGASRPLPHGRGRSPMNWSLIQGKTIFYTHLFRYLPGVDDGPILGMQAFDITPFDTAHTLHFKNLVSMVRLCVEYLPGYLSGKAELRPQEDAPATYYPKRTAEDGLVDWRQPAEEIYNLVRAVTRPFPGAFTYLDDDAANKMFIWKAIPFDRRLTWSSATPGEILEVFYDGSFLVQTADYALLVLDSEGVEVTEKDVGRRFGRMNQPVKVWLNLPA